MGTPFEGSAAVRCHLVQALRADLIGPFDAAGEELLSLPPSRWYLLGFLAPEAAREPEDPTADDELGAGDDDDDDDTATREPEVKRRHRLPASMGLSVLLPSGPPDGAADAVEVTLSYADYVPVPREETADPGQDDAARVLWRRVPRSPVVLSVPLDARRLAAGVEVPESKGLRLQGQLLPAAAPGLPAGTRALSLFLINGRDPGDPRARDAAFVFQVQLALAYPGGLVPRPNLRDAEAVDFDDRVADLQYRGRFEVAVGHNVATETFALPGGGLGARTAWLPEATVPRIVTREVPEVETRMDTLAALAEGADAGGLQAALRGLPEAYGLWIAAQREVWLGPPGSPRVATQQAVLDRAEAARTRISRGIALLGEDAEVRAAFGLANRAMALAGRRRRDGEPRWYLFQLAFLLLNLPGIADDGDDDRELVELIFFPTGGGKTEAYFGVIAFLLVLRRLRGQRRPDGGLGVAVLLRYTLRLLTLDQLGRAATLICALETLRRADRPKSAKSADSADSADSGRLGAVRWTVGLWVGRSATANTLAEVARQVLDYKNDRGASPCPLTECPWCRRPLDKDSLTLVSRGRATEDLVEVVVACTSFQCEFSAGRNPEGLPVLFVDEQIYRELPSFLVATVDKFAMLPWRGEAGLLLGRGVEARVGRGFLSPGGPGEARGGKLPAGAVALPAGLLPPELIVQDELHLIAGPLGTMAGLYETAVETLCSRRGEDGRVRRPKVMASTATVRRSGEQIRALFGRHRMALFPPPGIDEGETFFARCDPGHPGRVYVGVAAPGRPMKAVLLRTYVTLLAAAEHAFARDGGTGAAAADPYMTLAGYFNSLRELGGMRRLVEDEVYSRTSRAEERRPFQALGQRQPQQGQRPEAPAGPHPWLRSRAIRQEPIELTSRETTALIKEHKSRLEVPHQAGRRSVDVVLATNMISVGVDIDRLGAHGGGGPAQVDERVHPGLEPGGARSALAGAGGDGAQPAQAARPLALRAVCRLSRVLLPLCRASESDAIFGAGAGSGPGGGARGHGPARTTGAHAARGDDADRGASRSG